MRAVYAREPTCIDMRAARSGPGTFVSYLFNRLTALQSSSPVRALGRYLLFGEIASGGMASVHFGRLSGAAGFARMVAIKRLHANFAKDPSFVTMFLDEARLAARIRHPNVVSTLDVVATDGEIFLVMDYVHGQSLSRLWRAMRKINRQTDPRIVAAIMSCVLHGLHAAHEAKGERGEPLDIVHRDVSPQNILVGADGVSRVLDFGVAKAAGRMQTTREGRIKGKIAYMPPEQLEDATVTRQTDIYAAAVVTWEMLTGRRAFDGEHEAAVVAAVLGHPLPSPSKLVPRVPVAFDVVVMRGLARNANRRYATAREMALDLERCAGIASMSEVGDWVQTYARDELARRDRRMAAIEVVSPLDRAARPSIPSPHETPTRPSWGALSPEATDLPSCVSQVAVTPTISRLLRRSRDRLAVASTVAGVGLLTAFELVRAAAFGALPPSREVAASVMSAAAPVPTIAEAPLPPRPAPTPVVAPMLVAAAADPPVAVEGAVADAKAQPPPRPRPAPAVPRPAKPTRHDCDPPFSVNESGHKHFKAECLD